MSEQAKDNIQNSTLNKEDDSLFDYTYVSSIARIAIYDDFKSAPRVIEIPPAATNEFIENLASKTYEQAKLAGGTIPYTAIREVSENCIHAQFTEVVVSIFDNGNTIRFSDQGPGIAQKDKVKEPGFTSAIEPMKHYIRGVGSGLPLVKDYLDAYEGRITIEDNLNNGSVITLSLTKQQTPSTQRVVKKMMPALIQRHRTILLLLAEHGAMGGKDINEIVGIPQATVSTDFKKLEEMNLVEKSGSQRKRILTNYGYEVTQQLQNN